MDYLRNFRIYSSSNLLLCITSICFFLIVQGCSIYQPATFSESTHSVAELAYPVPPPGTATSVWEEPMVDVVRVPPGLDPEGHYYMPAHEEVVEIRQGKWQYYKD